MSIVLLFSLQFLSYGVDLVFVKPLGVRGVLGYALGRVREHQVPPFGDVGKAERVPYLVGGRVWAVLRRFRGDEDRPEVV